MNAIGTAEGLTQLVREVFTHHMLEVSTEPTFVIDPDGTIVIANRAVGSLGWDPAHLIGRAWDDVLDGFESTPQRMLSSHVAHSAPGIAVVRDGRVRGPDGHIEVVQVITYRLWLGESGAPSVIVLRPRRAAVVSAAVDGVMSGFAAAGA